jgi:hypothetical protein
VRQSQLPIVCYAEKTMTTSSLQGKNLDFKDMKLTEIKWEGRRMWM